MHRPLGAFETALCLTSEFGPFNVVIVLRLERGPSEASLRRALGSLLQARPMLRIGIVRRDGRRWFETQQGVAPRLETVEREDDDHWQRVVEDELNRPLEVDTAPLMRCSYLAAAEAAGTCEIVFTFHHAIIDGTAIVVLLEQLLDQCGPESARPELTVVEPLPAVEELFPQAFRGLRAKPRVAAFMARQMADELSYRIRARGTRRPPIRESARCHIEAVSLDERATSRLVKRSRLERVTLNSVVSAAMLLAVSKHLYGGDPAPMRYFSFADLRPYLSPRTTPERLGCQISMLRFTTAVDPDRGLWELAGELTAQVHTATRRGAKFCSMLVSPMLMKKVVGQRAHRMGTTAVSYSGVARLAKHHGPIEVRELHAFVSNISLGPEYTAQVRMESRRLWWDIVWMDIDMELSLARTIAGEILAILGGEPQRG